MAPRETENNAYAKFWGDKKRALWYVMVFSGAVNCNQEPKVPYYSSQILLVGYMITRAGEGR